MDLTPDMRQHVADTLRYVAGRIRALRQQRGLTVQQLAERCDIERSNLSRLEAGRSNVTLRTLCVICRMLDVDLRELLPAPARVKNER